MRLNKHGGIAVGAPSLIGDLFGESNHGSGSGRSITQLLAVASIFIGAAIAGLVVAYALLKKPLGLFGQRDET
jgi:hypothetical protein